MSLPGLMSIGKTREDFLFWLQAHQSDHDRIAVATDTLRIILDPFDMQDQKAQMVWLLDHRRAHDEVNGKLRIAGANLDELDFSDPAQVDAWSDLNYLEHNQWNGAIPP